MHPGYLPIPRYPEAVRSPAQFDTLFGYPPTPSLLRSWGPGQSVPFSGIHQAAGVFQQSTRCEQTRVACFSRVVRIGGVGGVGGAGKGYRCFTRKPDSNASASRARGGAARGGPESEAVCRRLNRFAGSWRSAGPASLLTSVAVVPALSNKRDGNGRQKLSKNESFLLALYVYQDVFCRGFPPLASTGFRT